MPPMIDIRDDIGKLLMRYDPDQGLIEIQRRGIKTSIDLKQYQRNAMSDTSELSRIRHCIKNQLLNGEGQKLLLGQELTTDECIELIKDVAGAYVGKNIRYPGLDHDRLLRKKVYDYLLSNKDQAKVSDESLTFETCLDIIGQIGSRYSVILSVTGRPYPDTLSDASATPQGGLYEHNR
jgi:hypothetical protein